MSKEQRKLVALPRENYGKGAARALRRAGQIPAIIYVKGKDSLSYSLEEKEIKRQYHRGGFFGKVLKLDSDKGEIMVLPKDLQLHPVTDRIEHADFIQVDDKSEFKVLIPVKFLGLEKCPGIRKGGNLNVVRHDLELWATTANIPDEIVIDITSLNIGDSIHLSEINLPEGVRSVIERDFTVATIAGRLAKEEEPTAEGAEGEEGAEGGSAEVPTVGDEEKAKEDE